MRKKTAQSLVKEQPEGDSRTPDELIESFIKRVNRLEKRFKGHAYANMWMVSREECIALRDRLAQPTLF